MLKFADETPPYLSKNNKSKECMSVFNSWWMLLGFTFTEKFAIAYLSSVCPCRKKHKKKVHDSESWLRQEESEKNLRSPETPLLNTRQLRSIEFIGIFFYWNYHSDFKIRELLPPPIFSSILLIKSFSNYKSFLVDSCSRIHGEQNREQFSV